MMGPRVLRDGAANMTSDDPPDTTPFNSSVDGSGRAAPAEPELAAGLRQALDTLNAQWEAQLAKVKGDHKDKLTRQNVKALLKVIADHLARALYLQHEPLDGHPVVSDHDAVAVLRRFIDALEDIEFRGRRGLFTPPPAGLTTPARLTTDELKLDRAIIELAAMEHKEGGHTQQKSSDTKVATALKKKGFKFRDKKGERTVTPTRGKIKSLRDNDKKRS